MTVIIALVGLLVVDIPFLTVMGLAAAGTVAIAVLIAITLLPALFGFVGERLGRTQPRARLQRPPPRPRASRPLSTRWATLVTRRPLLFVVGALALTLTIAIPATHMELGLPGRRLAADQHHRAQGVRPLTEGFGPGFNGPLTLVVDGHRRHARGAGRDRERGRRQASRARPASPPCPTRCRTRPAT